MNDLPSNSAAEPQQDEIRFWDERSEEAEYRSRMGITPDEYIDREVWLKAWRDLLPDVKGKRVLDCGSGLGAIAAWFAQQGADVIGFDIATGMAKLATEYAHHHGVDVSMIASTFEELPLADDSVDLAVGQYILHHTDLDRTVAQLARVVRPGGMGLFVENMALNPIVQRYVTSSAFEQGVLREGSPEECPILPEKVEMMRRNCRELRLHWPSFVFFEILFSRLPVIPRRSGQWLDDVWYKMVRRNPSALRWSYFAIVEMRF